jgi:hypothetical protein
MGEGQRKTLTGDTVHIACPVGGCGSRTHLDPAAVVAKEPLINSVRPEPVEGPFI